MDEDKTIWNSSKTYYTLKKNLYYDNIPTIIDSFLINLYKEINYRSTNIKLLQMQNNQFILHNNYPSEFMGLGNI